MNIDYWVDSAATGTNDGSSYANAWTSLQSATSVAAGSVVAIVSTSYELDSGGILDFANGTVTNPVVLITVDSSGNYTRATSANYEMGSNLDINLDGYVVCWGVYFKAADDLSNIGQNWVMDEVTLEVGVTSGSGYIEIRSALPPTNKLEYKNTKIILNNTSDYIHCANVYFDVFLKNIEFVITSAVGYLFSINNAPRHGFIQIEDTKFHSITTGIFQGSIGGTNRVHLSRCIIPSGISLISGTVDTTTACMVLHGCDAGDGYHYFNEKYLSGEIVEDTSIYRTNSIAKYDGTNGYSAEFVPNSNISPVCPLEFCIYNGYIDTDNYTTNITFTVHFALEGTTTPLNEGDFYFYVEYADGADNALGVIATTRLDPLSTGSAHSTTSSEWTIGATNVQMTDSLTITIGTLAGNIASGPIKIVAGLTTTLGASEFLFIDPGVEIS